MHLTRDKKSEIIEALNAGGLPSIIAVDFDVSKRTVQRLRAQGLPRVVDASAYPIDVPPLMGDPTTILSSGILDPSELIADALAGFRRIRQAMESIAGDVSNLERDRVQAGRVAVEAGAKIVVVAAMVGGGASMGQPDGEQTELAMIENIVEGKGK